MYKIKLSPYHKIFYNEWKLDPNNHKYHIVFDQTLHGNLSLERLKTGLGRLVADYLLINSHVALKDNQCYWETNQHIQPLQVLNNAPNAVLYNHVISPFDLENGPLYKFIISNISDVEHRLIMVFHHIIIDGLSIKELLQQISAYYNDSLYTVKISLESQKQLLINTISDASNSIHVYKHDSKQFWEGVLSTYETVDLRFLHTNQCGDHEFTEINKISEISFSFDESVLIQLDKVRQVHKITNFYFAQMIFALTLYRYTRQKNFIISYPVAIKSHARLLYGAGVNIVFMPYQLSQCLTIGDLVSFINQFGKHIVCGNFYQCPMFDTISYKDKRLLDASFVQTNLRQDALNFEGVSRVVINYDLHVDLPAQLIFEQGMGVKNILFKARYNKTHISVSVLHDFIAYFKCLFCGILDDLMAGIDNKAILTYDYISYCNGFKVIHAINANRRSYEDAMKPIHTLFEERAQLNPDNIAVVCGDVKMSYGMLNKQANQLAAYINNTCHTDTNSNLIALCLDKNEFMIVAMLAVLKAGCAYMPLDPSHPIASMRNIILQSKPIAIILRCANASKIKLGLKLPLLKPEFDNHNKNSPYTLIIFDNHAISTNLASYSCENLGYAIRCANIAYVIYTSGTTGDPKGVMVSHSNVINFIFGMPFDNSKHLNAAFTSSYTFDVSVFDVWCNLLHGHTVFIVTPVLLQDINQFEHFIVDSAINRVYLPASLFRLYAPCLSRNAQITQILTGVETLYCSELASCANKHLVVGYGPSETTVCVTAYVYNEAHSYIKAPIGKPIANVSCYVLNESLQLMPVGAIGELYIAGANVAIGYLHQPHLMSDKFISGEDLPFYDSMQNNNSPLYRTGDLVRILADGNLEYMGRIDNQVKILGYRVELDEITSLIMQHADIQKVVAITKIDHNNTYIVGYYLAHRQLEEAVLLAFLANKLPQYILQCIKLVQLDTLPITTNGKLDIASLPEPSLATKCYVMPSNHQEQLVCDAFSSTLGIAKIGIHDDFFALGGNSLKAITLLSKLQANFWVDFSSILVLKTPFEITKRALPRSNSLQQQLDFVRSLHKKNQLKNAANTHANTGDVYNQFICTLRGKDVQMQLNVTNVLLTGATGFLGCNILHELLQSTSYKVFLLIKAANIQDATKKINQLFNFYFHKSLDALHEKRVFVVVGNIRYTSLGMSRALYDTLAHCIDTVIHAAALVKHYGSSKEFYSVNVHGTRNMLKFANTRKKKFFHYISTCSVLRNGYQTPLNTINNEDILPDNIKMCDNIYIKTKLQGELEAIKYRKYDLKVNIYRVGNLAFMLNNHCAPYNAQENAFYNWIRYLIKLGCVTQLLNTVEISPADLTAEAIVKIFDKKMLSNNIFHIFNNQPVKIAKTINHIKTASFDKFIGEIMQDIHNTHDHSLVTQFLLHQGWLDKKLQIQPIQISNKKTQVILKLLGFKWQRITNVDFNSYLKKVAENVNKN